jgi:hypothetical protein
VERGRCVNGSVGIVAGCNNGTVAPGLPAGERVTAGMSETRRLCPKKGLEEVPNEGEAAGGTGSLSATERFIGDWVSVLPSVDETVVTFTVG